MKKLNFFASIIALMLMGTLYSCDIDLGDLLDEGEGCECGTCEDEDCSSSNKSSSFLSGTKWVAFEGDDVTYVITFTDSSSGNQLVNGTIGMGFTYQYNHSNITVTFEESQVTDGILYTGKINGNTMFVNDVNRDTQLVFTKMSNFFNSK